MTKCDVAIIGGGILGVSISYWLSSLYEINVYVIEKESEVAQHASSRNTGVVHSPFYLNPQTKKLLARCAFVSYDLWKKFSETKKLEWKSVGTLEVALDQDQHSTLEKYLKWGSENGIDKKDLELLDKNEVQKREPNINCYSALFCKNDASVDYGLFTRELKNESERNGTRFLTGKKVDSIKTNENKNIISFQDKTQIESDYIINCAGGNSLDIAKMTGVAKEYSDLHFRGEYWIVDQEYQDLVKTNIYSVARMPDFPFLDPHWIKRSNGTTEIGPNAVPVMSAETYSGYLGDVSIYISKLKEIFTGNAKKLILNPDFISLVSKEWLSSISKSVMIERVQQFIPKIKPSYFSKQGTAGIRTPIITPEGKFLSDVMELEGSNSYHILNYNSPGATGAPAFSAHVVAKLEEKEILNYAKKSRQGIWDYDKIIDQT